MKTINLRTIQHKITITKLSCKILELLDYDKKQSQLFWSILESHNYLYLHTRLFFDLVNIMHLLSFLSLTSYFLEIQFNIYITYTDLNKSLYLN